MGERWSFSGAAEDSQLQQAFEALKLGHAAGTLVADAIAAALYRKSRHEKAPYTSNVSHRPEMR
jgi:hypothetical protein